MSCRHLTLRKACMLCLLFVASGLRLAYADDALLLSDPAKDAVVRLDLIRGATKRIYLSSYLVFDDSVGQRALAELRAKARQGVEVVIVFDGLNNSSLGRGFDQAMLRHLTGEGIKIYEYNPPTSDNLDQITHRMHDKLLIVDSEYLVVGDRNVGKDYFGLGKTPFQSRDVVVHGNSAQEAESYFTALLKQHYVRRTGTEVDALQNEVTAAAMKLDSISRRPDSRLLNFGWNWKSELKPVQEAHFIAPQLGSLSAPAANIEARLAAAITNAKASVIVENPYVITTDRMKAAFTTFRSRPDTKLEVVTNSQASNDAKIAAAAWDEDREFFNRLRADVWEHPGSETQPSSLGPEGRRGLRAFVRRLGRSSAVLHSKAMVVDSNESFIKSFNFDPRSAKLNSEVCLYIRDPDFAQKVTTAIRDDLATNKFKLVATGGQLITANYLSCGRLYRWIAKALRPQLR